MSTAASTPVASARGIAALMAPQSVAIIGASADPTRIGGRPIATMLRAGFKGTIYPVNPNRAEIQGIKAYASVADLPAVPDAAIVAVPGRQAIDAIAALGQRGTAAAVVFSSGFAALHRDSNVFASHIFLHNRFICNKFENPQKRNIAPWQGNRYLPPTFSYCLPFEE